MKAFLRAIIVLPLGAILLVFALANRGSVTIILDPLGLSEPPVSFTAPLFLAVFLALMLGVLIGGTAMWISEGRHRRAVRLHLREIERQRVELDELRRRDKMPPLPQVTMIG